MIHRRDVLKIAAGAGALALLSGGRLGLVSQALAQAAPPAGPYSLPALGYGYEALEPTIDTTTMRIHHSAHHQAYVNGANAAITKTQLASAPMEEILSDLSKVPEEVRTAIRNNLGGHYNHTHFWQIMTPGGAKEPGGDLKSAIDGAFGSFANLQERVNTAGLGRFGSGWAWLVVGRDKKLAVISTANQDTPLELGARPVIGVDVWEHAYYLKHQNKRADYLKGWWSVVNWDKAAENFKKAAG